MCASVTIEALDKLLAPLPDVMGPTEVANVLGVSVASVTVWLREGELPGYKVGARSWRILKVELREYLLRQRNQDSDGTPRPEA